MDEAEDIEYAGFWIRVGAAIIDSILVALITVPPLIGIYGMEYFDSSAMIVGAWDFWI